MKEAVAGKKKKKAAPADQKPNVAQLVQEVVKPALEDIDDFQVVKPRVKQPRNEPKPETESDEDDYSSEEEQPLSRY